MFTVQNLIDKLGTFDPSDTINIAVKDDNGPGYTYYVIGDDDVSQDSMTEVVITATQLA